jgi:hypothetical protein
MNYKRKRPKKQRAGCLFCKPHKGNGQKRKSQHVSVLRRTGPQREIELAALET